MAEHPIDEFGRVIFHDRAIPDPFTPESRFAQWHGRTCGPWTVISGIVGTRHRYLCDHGWIKSGEWSFVCGLCHPDAVDMPGSSDHQMRSAPSDRGDER